MTSNLRLDKKYKDTMVTISFKKPQPSKLPAIIAATQHGTSNNSTSVDR